MPRPILRSLAASLAATLALGWSAVGLAQDAPKDDALDKLLEKVQKDDKKTDEAKSDKAKKDEPKKDDAKKDEPKKDEVKKDAPKAKDAKPAEPEDKALDGLLEKLGGREEMPKTTGQAKGDAEAPKTKGDQPNDPAAAKFKPDEKKFDEHLEELTGRIKKKKNDQQQQQQGGQGGSSSAEDDENNPLTQTIKKMREVEKRLSQPDTGEETRKRQAEIVQDLDTLIAQARRRMQQQTEMRTRRMPGQQQPGQQQPEGQPGTQAGGVGPQATKKPTTAKAAVGNKDAWGHLPPALREEMQNVFREKALPRREMVVGRYYESVTKKSLQPKE